MVALNESQLHDLNENYFQDKGTRVQKFVCPITLSDDPDVVLCNGHILNEAIREASDKTIIERKDVDNYFGVTIEPDLVQWLNLPTLTPDEIFHKSSKLHVTIPNGEKIEAFFKSNRNTGDKFQQIELFDAEHAVVSSPFLKTDKPEFMEFKDAEVEGIIVLNNGAFLGSLIKSAYLAFFSIFGYSWVFSAGGDKVRRALASFYHEKGGIEGAHSYFKDFQEAVSVELTDMFQNEDTIKTGALILHYGRRFKAPAIFFALSCLFRINKRTIMVTLPSFLTTGFDFSAYKDYQSFLEDHSMAHDAYFARFTNGVIYQNPDPLRVMHAPSESQQPDKHQ